MPGKTKKGKQVKEKKFLGALDGNPTWGNGQGTELFRGPEGVLEKSQEGRNLHLWADIPSVSRRRGGPGRGKIGELRTGSWDKVFVFEN